MPRYFIEVSYKGTNYGGFQTQHNADTVQSQVEKAFFILQKEEVGFTGSSRTDAGVHALQNFFHFDYNGVVHPQFLYKINAILPDDIVVRSLKRMPDNAHSRFDAISRQYKYFIYRNKDPFLKDRAYYFPYTVDIVLLEQAADLLLGLHDFRSFSKKNTQVKTFMCDITYSKWSVENNCLVYSVRGNRFLRGMVRALVATMLKVGRKTISMEEFAGIMQARDSSRSYFNAPAQGLFLVKVDFAEHF